MYVTETVHVCETVGEMIPSLNLPFPMILTSVYVPGLAGSFILTRLPGTILLGFDLAALVVNVITHTTTGGDEVADPLMTVPPPRLKVQKYSGHPDVPAERGTGTVLGPV